MSEFIEIIETDGTRVFIRKSEITLVQCNFKGRKEDEKHFFYTERACPSKWEYRLNNGTVGLIDEKTALRIVEILGAEE